MLKQTTVNYVFDEITADFPDIMSNNELTKNMFYGFDHEKMVRVFYRIIRRCMLDIKKRSLVDKYVTIANILQQYGEELKLKGALKNMKCLKNVLLEKYKFCYFKSRNSVFIKCRFKEKNYNYWSGIRLSRNNGEDRDVYPFKIPATDLDEFLRANGIKYDEVTIDPASIPQYYCFDNKVAVNLTPAFVRKWWNSDCPQLWRVMPNTDNSTNCLEVYLPEFMHNLVECGLGTVYVSKEITADEVSRLTKGYEDTIIAKEMFAVLKARDTSEEEKDRVLSWVKSFEEKIQRVIDNNKETIKNHLIEMYPTRIESVEPFRMDEFFGLDCGFLYVYTTDPEYISKKRVARNLSSNRSDHMDVRFPYYFQSTTVQREMFDKVKEVVKNSLGIDLYCRVVYD